MNLHTPQQPAPNSVQPARLQELTAEQEAQLDEWVGTLIADDAQYQALQTELEHLHHLVSRAEQRLYTRQDALIDQAKQVLGLDTTLLTPLECRLAEARAGIP